MFTTGVTVGLAAWIIEGIKQILLLFLHQREQPCKTNVAGEIGVKLKAFP